MITAFCKSTNKQYPQHSCALQCGFSCPGPCAEYICECITNHFELLEQLSHEDQGFALGFISIINACKSDISNDMILAMTWEYMLHHLSKQTSVEEKDNLRIIVFAVCLVFWTMGYFNVYWTHCDWPYCYDKRSYKG